jgi:hypothetical protein
LRVRRLLRALKQALTNSLTHRHHFLVIALRYHTVTTYEQVVVNDKDVIPYGRY